MMHACVGVPDEQFLAGTRDDDRGRSAWQDLNPQFVLQCLVLDLLEKVGESLVESLCADPRLQSAVRLRLEHRGRGLFFLALHRAAVVGRIR